MPDQTPEPVVNAGVVDVEAIAKLFSDKLDLAIKGLRATPAPIPAPADDNADGKFGFKSAGELVQTFRRNLRDGGPVDSRIKAVTTFSATSPTADGGFAVPAPLESQIYSAPVASEPLLDKITTLRSGLPGATVTLPVDNNGAPWDADGIRVYNTIAEGGAKTASKFAGDQRVLTYKKYCAFVPITDELLEDSSADIMNYAIAKAVQKLKYLQAADMVANVLASAATLSVNRYSAGNIYFIDLANMLSRISPHYRNDGLTWLTSTTGEAEFWTMAFDPSATGGKVPVMLPGHVANDLFTRAMGVPVNVHASMANVGAPGDLALINLREVVGVYKKPFPKIDSSAHFAFDQNLTILRVEQRFVANTWATAPESEPKPGVGALSAFVKLN